MQLTVWTPAIFLCVGLSRQEVLVTLVLELVDPASTALLTTEPPSLKPLVQEGMESVEVTS